MPFLTSPASEKIARADAELRFAPGSERLLSGAEIKQKTMWLAHGPRMMRAQDARELGSLLPKRIPGGTHQVAKQSIALHGEGRELLAVKFDAGLAETIDEAAVV